nr:uncharacterized protein LOC111421607 [Onthophagus taurus]
MDISDEDMAKLVLGYLRSEKCKGAAKMFVQSSRHLQDAQNSIRRAKHFITHKHGYCLREILREYAKLYTIIIEYLEDLSYMSDITTRDMPSKLIYLLERAQSRESYTPSLSPRSRSSTPVKQLQNTKPFSSQNLSRIDEKSPSEFDVNTTPLHDLPGHFSSNNNTSEEKRHKSTEESDLTDNNDSEGSIAKVLLETVLENREFQEKLVENINSVIQKPSEENVVENNPVNNELDSAIKAIVDKTEHDPVFERLLSDLIGPEKKLETDLDENKQKEKVSEEISQPEVPEVNLELNPTINPTDEVKSTPPKRSMLTLEGTKVDLPPKQNLTVNTNTGEVILYDGTLENYMKEQPMNSQSTTTSVNSTCSSNLVLNAGLLMVQPQTVVQQPQSYFLWNSSQVVNMGVPQYKVNAISDHDILSMPTVIVCDENQQELGINKGVEEIKAKTLKKIAPKPMVDMSKGNKKSKRKSPRKHSHSPKTTKIQDVEKKVEIKIEVLRESQNHQSNLDNCEGDKIESKSSSDKIVKETTPKNKLIDESTSTPRSASHIRILDFDFTPKSISKQINKEQKPRSGSSPKRKSPNTKGNHQPTKISKSLFSSPAKNQRKRCGGDSEKKGAKKSWDADLRALAASTAIREPPKREKSKRKPKKSEKLNKTEENAKAIEDNLRADEIANNEDIKTEKTKESTLYEKKVLADCAEKDEILIQKEIEPGADTEEEGESTFTLINYNRAPRIKRKCNIDGNVKKVGKVTKVKEVKNLDVCNNKMILSPSKLNASKRTFVEKIDGNVKNEQEIEKEKEKIEENLKVPLTPRLYDENELLTLNFAKFTPENIPTVSFSDSLDVSGVMKATRNLLPLLDTPLKIENTLLIPKTPGISTPNNIKETPITKMINEHCENIDLVDIETPKILITPSIGITPYVNRRTDYSTSSSYYQPSDTEQNKSIEQLIEETKRDKKIIVEKENDANKNDLTSIVNKLNSFNKNVIGRKNLSLVTKVDTVSFGDSESETDFIDNEINDEESKCESKKNVTVIQNEKEGGKSRYSLRSRSKEDAKKVDDKNNKNDSLEKEEINAPEFQLLDPKDKILRELEKKRQETIALIKKPELQSKTTSKSNPKKEIVDNKKLNDEKTVLKSQEIKKPVKAKSNPKPQKTTTRKGNQRKVNKNVTKVINIVGDPEKNDSNLINPLNYVEAHLGNNSNDNKKKYESNQELLVRDLKERGIYLLPKNKKEIILEPPNDNSSTELINVEIKNVLPLKKRDSNKSFEINTETNIQDKNNLLQDDLNLTDSFIDDKEPIIFSDNLKLLDYIIFHDPNESNKKTLQDYDLKCLDKTYNVPVYWEEYKFDDSRPLKVTKTDFFFDLEFNSEQNQIQTKNQTNTKINEKIVESGKKYRRKSLELNKKSTLVPAKKSNRSESVVDVKSTKKKSLDLMDIAIVGEKFPKTDETNTKRKADEVVASEKNKCPKLCDNLLSGLNVEHFLSQIHKD